jgi:hypothetical protein
MIFSRELCLVARFRQRCWRDTRDVFKEQGEARPSLQDVIERFQIVPTGEFGKLFPHAGVKILAQWPAQRLSSGQTILGVLAIDRSLYLNNASIRRTTSMAIGDNAVSFLPRPCAGRSPGYRSWRRTDAARAPPAGCLPDRSGISPSQIDLVITKLVADLVSIGRRNGNNFDLKDKEFAGAPDGLYRARSQPESRTSS